MRIAILFSLLVFVNSASAESGLEYGSIWGGDESRFNWYCDIPRDSDQVENAVEKPNPKAASEEDEAVAALKKLREDAEKKRALAIVKPTPENLKSYIVAQEALMDRAQTWCLAQAAI